MRGSPSIWAESVSRSLRRLDRMLERELALLRAAGRFQQHPARGLFLDEAHVLALVGEESPQALQEVERLDREIAALRAAERGESLERLGSLFGLSALELDILLIAVAPEFEARYETLYAYVQNDVTRRHPTVDLALRLVAGSDAKRVEARAALHAAAALRRERLISVGEGAWSSRTIASDERVASFLLARDEIDERLVECAREVVSQRRPEDLPLEPEVIERLKPGFRHVLDHGGVVLVTARRGAGKRTTVASLCRADRRRLLVADLHQSQPSDALHWLRREAVLRNAALYLSLPVDHALERVVHVFEGRGIPVFVGKRKAGEDDELALFKFELPTPTGAARLRLWREAAPAAATEDLEEVAGKFALTPAEIERAASRAVLSAAPRVNGHNRITREELDAAARAQAGTGLARLAQKIEPRHEWDDLVLPQRVVRQLREICARVRHRERVLVKWDFGRKLAGPGLNILFAGPSGTGKTMSAGVLARELGLELYRIDLATVISKYIGETEKNLARIFDEAENSNAILFFDEADALFGKRSEVKDAHDRYANIEVAYLLQRMDTYPGVAILATNLGANIDEAFARRMAHSIEFPFPDVPLRERLWRQSLPEKAPVGGSVDFRALASQFEVTGGNIRNITLAAAYLAASEGSEIGMEHLVRATARELEKIGRLPSRAEFREYYELVRQRP